MSTLVHQRSGHSHLLAPTTLVGRSPTSDLCVPAGATEVSRFHALIYWAEGAEEEGWWVRDLGSRNGTFVDGVHLPPGRDVRLADGGVIAFGTRNDGWLLSGTASPPVVLVGHHPDHEIRLIGRALLLPHDDTPEAMVYRHRDLGWVIETETELQPLDPARSFFIGGTEWRAIVPHTPDQTRAVADTVTVVVRVSADEEYVEVLAERAGQSERITAGTGSALYFLLTLARRRQADAAAGIAEAEQGWVHGADEARDHRTTEQVLNQWVFRLRARFAAAGYEDIDVIERRARTGLLRLGYAALRIEGGAAEG